MLTARVPLPVAAHCVTVVPFFFFSIFLYGLGVIICHSYVIGGFLRLLRASALSVRAQPIEDLCDFPTFFHLLLAHTTLELFRNSRTCRSSEGDRLVFVLLNPFGLTL